MNNGRIALESFFLYDPAVFVVENEYCIIFNTIVEGVGWVEVDGEKYVVAHNGILVSDKKVHKLYVPMDKLNKAGKYEIAFVPVYERKAYFATSGEEQRREYSFKAPDTCKETFNVYHISDTHSMIENPVATANFFGDDLDLLIMNGDIPNHCGEISQVMAVFDLASRITKGAIPIAFSRGNHDTRGGVALHYDDYTPTTKLCNTYYTFRIGKLWGIILDCGEDKVDDCESYGGLACFEPFRRVETEFVRSVVKNSDNEYEADGIEYRMVICHIPIDIEYNEFEREVYTEWTSLINEINPDVVLYGHCHKTYFVDGNVETRFGKLIPPAIVGADPRNGDFKGLALTLSKEGYLARFTDKEKNVLEERKISKANRRK